MAATAFTPLASLAGGALIGVAAVLLMAAQGRIAGVSGFAARLLPPYADDGFFGRFAFILGIASAPLVIRLDGGWVPVPDIAAGPMLLAIAGVLVGFGAVWGNGCTSGHGICGLSRLSVRSATATAAFMATAFATVFTIRHLL
ncbi:YeeE/YedE thiosulfate transporter family protein [Roseomonas sp. CAU 1739]|uniref:YeeE/YedE family protein n=1 Tax=Roseomonas sp. CAU 1739 TaxID=3140364 RepID=UPI00325AE29C